MKNKLQKNRYSTLFGVDPTILFGIASLKNVPQRFHTKNQFHNYLIINTKNGGDGGS